MQKRYFLFLVLISLFSQLEAFEAKISKITEKIKARMYKGNSYREGCPVALEKLRYIQLDYYNMQHQSVKGELIVHKDVAEEVVEIFHLLYKKHFPIARMQLVSDFNGSDTLSMQYNNTSAFNCRYIAGTTKFSNHSYGRAIDLNPLFNPCIQNAEVSPSNALPYADRRQQREGMLHKNDFVIKLFRKYGWKWGGEWRSLKDYQHFEKRRGY
jgi:hypothetical protein